MSKTVGVMFGFGLVTGARLLTSAFCLWFIVDVNKIPPVKFQEIVRDGQATIVARMKVSTPGNHAFILRRLDTGAISSTTMFRAAFPSATDEAERAESSWIKHHWNDVALELAKDYYLSPLILPLAAASPDPNIVFRKSGKTLQQPTPVASPVSSSAHITDTPPVKRRREASPAATPARTQGAIPATPRRGATPSRTAAPTATPRRSARHASREPPATPATVSITSVKVVETIKEELPPPPPVVTIETPSYEDESRDLAQVAEQNMQEDIREQKELINKLKAEQQAKEEAARAVAAEASTADVEQAVSSDAPTSKREREEEPTEYKLNIKEPEVGERAIATNKRVQPGRLGPERKSLAWGALAFAVGAGAISLLPSLPSFF
ncbi:hypothetical protein BC629DRAFT_1596259 [Irpex lacteus]|nr:hypothetical protein BC629DRAFT_1596259 [Irpex lacteus]